MKLRWKYFIVLLVASLLPMAVVTLVSQNASKKLGNSVSAKTRQALLDMVKREIVFATENYALITRRAKSSLEFSLQMLKREADLSLSLPPPELGRIYFAEDFDDPNRAPKDLVPSPIHLKILPGGRLFPKPISIEAPNFLLAPGVDASAVKADVARFFRLSPVLKQIAGEFGTDLFWIYASLESGVHISYPGHGGYPETYDPRKRPWYKRAKKLGRLTWGPPIVDTTTQQLTFTVSVPLKGPDGAFAGVAAADVLIPKVLLTHRISSQWSGEMRPFLMGQSAISDRGKPLLWVMSREKRAPGETQKEGTPDVRTVYQEDHADFAGLARAMGDGNSGSVEMPYEGVDSVWAWAEIFPGLNFVMIAPKSMVLELPEEIGDHFSTYTRDQAFITVTAVFIVIFMVAGAALYFSHVNTANVMSVVKGFRRLEQGDLSVRLDLRLNDERDLIVTTFNQIMPRLEEHLQMRRALGVAKDIQQNLLPESNPVLSGYDIAGTSIYCEETGGDYYDFIPVRDDRLAVAVGDVSGHGVSAALLMATARALIMLRASMPGPTAAIINDVNRQLSLDTSNTGNFMTFFYCELATTEREVHWVRAGHDPGLIYDPTSDRFDELKGRGLALGLDPEFEYEEFRRSLIPGQIILLGTDGIWEMTGPSGEMFGKKRLREIIRQNARKNAGEIVERIIGTLDRFRGEQNPEDDVTLVVIKVEEGV